MIDITHYLRQGKDHAVSRTELAILTGLTDRAVRRAIEDARINGALIISTRNGGYYISSDVDEIQAFYRTEKARAISTLKRLKTMRSILKDNGIEV